MQPQNEAKHGGDLFGALYADPARLEGFLRAMTGTVAAGGTGARRHVSWRDVNTVVDIGTAQGCVPVELARRYPHLSGGGFDLPAVEPVFSRYVASHGLSDRLRFIPGDFLVDDLPRADVLVMGLILHDWDLPTKRMLIGKAYPALEKGGSLIIYELLIDDAAQEPCARTSYEPQHAYRDQRWIRFYWRGLCWLDAGRGLRRQPCRAACGAAQRGDRHQRNSAQLGRKYGFPISIDR